MDSNKDNIESVLQPRAHINRPLWIKFRWYSPLLFVLLCILTLVNEHKLSITILLAIKRIAELFLISGIVVSVIVFFLKYKVKDSRVSAIIASIINIILGAYYITATTLGGPQLISDIQSEYLIRQILDINRKEIGKHNVLGGYTLVSLGREGKTIYFVYKVDDNIMPESRDDFVMNSENATYQDAANDPDLKEFAMAGIIYKRRIYFNNGSDCYELVIDWNDIWRNKQMQTNRYVYSEIDILYVLRIISGNLLVFALYVSVIAGILYWKKHKYFPLLGLSFAGVCFLINGAMFSTWPYTMISYFPYCIGIMGYGVASISGVLILIAYYKGKK